MHSKGRPACRQPDAQDGCLPSGTAPRQSAAHSTLLLQAVIERERRGDYLGKTVQVVPHITDAIQDWIERVAALPVDGRPGVPP